MQIIDAIIREIKSPSIGAKHRYLYTVHIGGELVNTHHEPVHTTCRILQQRGIDGELRFWRRKADGSLKANYDFRIRRISAGAKFTIADDRRGVRVEKFSEFNRDVFGKSEA